MYYKDNMIEIRLGLGIKSFKKVNNTELNLILIKITDDSTELVIETFNTTSGLINFPVDGNYKLKIEAVSIEPYFVYMTINDSFIKEFIRQLKDVTCVSCCKGTCEDTCPKEIEQRLVLKRQSLFNFTNLIPYTIKPFHYGQVSVTNKDLFYYLQLYYNENLKEGKNLLAVEFYDYYLTNINSINIELFTNILSMYYYSLYFYTLSNLLTNGVVDKDYYTTIVDEFFDIKEVDKCLNNIKIKLDIQDIIKDTIVPINRVYYWQLEAEETITNVLNRIRPSYLETKNSKTLDVFKAGFIITNISIGKIAIAISGVDINNVYLEDSLGNNVTQLFDVAYDASYKIQIFVSKLDYVYSNIYFKFKTI